MVLEYNNVNIFGGIYRDKSFKKVKNFKLFLVISVGNNGINE